MPQGPSIQTSSSIHQSSTLLYKLLLIYYTLFINLNTIYPEVYFTTTKMSYTAFLTAAISLMMTLAVAQPVPVPTEAETVKVDVSFYPSKRNPRYGALKLTTLDSASLSAKRLYCGHCYQH